MDLILFTQKLYRDRWNNPGKNLSFDGDIQYPELSSLDKSNSMFNIFELIPVSIYLSPQPRYSKIFRLLETDSLKSTTQLWYNTEPTLNLYSLLLQYQTVWRMNELKTYITCAFVIYVYNRRSQCSALTETMSKLYFAIPSNSSNHQFR